MSDIREYMVDNACSSLDVSLDAGNSSGVSSSSDELPGLNVSNFSIPLLPAEFQF